MSKYCFNYRDFIDDCGCGSRVREPYRTWPSCSLEQCRYCCCYMCPHNPKYPSGPNVPSSPHLSSYMEALGNGQIIAQNNHIVFDVGSFDSVGNNITLDPSGTVFTINRTGLYLVEWNVNLAPGSPSAVIGILENGEGASGSATSTAGSISSGTVIHVDTVPFTISLRNYNSEITIENPSQWVNSAASIRIVRFADGPSV